MEYNVSKSLGNVAGGLVGIMFLAAKGYDFFVVNNEYSVLVSKDHCSIKSFSGNEVPAEIINKTAEYLNYKKFHTEKTDCLYIYNDDETFKSQGEKLR